MMTTAVARSAILALFVAAAGIALGASGSGPATCAGCDHNHPDPVHGGPITLRDWETNQTYTYRSLYCVLRDMSNKYAWARATWTSPSGNQVMLTHTPQRWEVEPPRAVALRLSKAGKCNSVIAFTTPDALAKWKEKHGLPSDLHGIALSHVSQLLRPPAAADGGEGGAKHWAEDAVRFATDSGLMVGHPSGEFDGESSLTRYEMASVLQRLMKRLEARESHKATAGDPEAGPSEAMVEELANIGIPQREARRITKLASSAENDAKQTQPATGTLWPDVPDGHWAAQSVAFATNQGLMAGYPDGTFRGQQPLTRYEMAVILSRLNQKARLGPNHVPADPTHGESAGLGSNNEARRASATTPVAGQDGGSPSRSAKNRPERLAQEHRQTTSPRSRPRRRRATTDLPAILGQSGVLETPTADVKQSDGVTTHAAMFDGGDAHFVGATANVDGDAELSAGLAGGDGPDGVILTAKKLVYRSADGQTRSSIGVIDATGETDATVYGAVSRDLTIGRSAHDGRTTVTAGLGSGELLEGLFANAVVPVNSRTDGLIEWADVRGETHLNAGLVWEKEHGVHLKGGVVDGKLAFGLSVAKGF